MIVLTGQNVLLIGAKQNKLNDGVAISFIQAGANLVLADVPEIDRLVEQITTMPELDTVVISPKWFSHTPFLDATIDDIDQAIHQNYEQITFVIQAVAKHFIENKRQGSIIILSSIVSLMPFVHTNLTGSTLAALEVVAKMAAVDFGAHGIRVNIVAVGWLEDERSEPLLGKDGQLHTPEDIPLRRVGQPEDVGRVCCFLASSLSSYVTGAILPVDGGFLLTKSSAPSPFPFEGVS